MEIKRDYYLDKLIQKKTMGSLRLLQELEGAVNLIYLIIFFIII